MALMQSYDKRKFTRRQWLWCCKYERETTFEPLMCDFVAGVETFAEAAKTSVAWFESWSSDAYLRITADAVPPEARKRAAR